MPKLTLISHQLCPYVQRVIISLTEKGIAHERVYIDLANKPDWFSAISPLGKVPLLRVDDAVLFESAVICEYLEETTPHPLHPADPLERAKHRAWFEFSSSVLGDLWGFQMAADDDARKRKAAELRTKLAALEANLGNGPYFAGERFHLVDAAFGPVFRYLEVFKTVEDFGVFADLPKVNAWRQALAARPSVRDAVPSDYAERVQAYLNKA